MNKHYLLFICFTMCYSKIQINITTSNKIRRTFIKHKGSDIKQVTDKEIQLFNITNENLNRGVRVEMGKEPDEVFLKDPTVYGKVFQKYNWPDVRRKLSVRNITIVEFIKEDVVLKRDEHINYSADTIVLKTDMMASVTNTATAIWNKAGLPDDVLHFEVLIDFEYGKAHYNVTWRDSTTITFDLLINKTKGILKIQPGQSIITKLLAEKIILLVEIELDAHLVGNIVANYAHEYGKYHLWSPTIENIMKAAKLRNEITTKLLFEIRFHANARIEVIDKESGKEIMIQERKFHKKQKISFF